MLANGGAWQADVPNLGNGAASDQEKATDVTIEEENLTIDLHQEFAAVAGRRPSQERSTARKKPSHGRRRFLPQPGAARFEETIEQGAEHDRAANLQGERRERPEGRLF